MDVRAILLDIDGVLYVGDEPIEGAHAALDELRALVDGRLRLVTNTTSKSRREIVEHLGELGFTVSPEEVLTPAAIALQLCRERGFERVALLVADGLRADLAKLREAGGDPPDAVILGDLGSAFDDAILNRAFRWLMDGAELVALQHNRFYRRGGGLVLDVGAYAAALEYATGREAIVAGKPSAAFFGAALAAVGVDAPDAVMVGDDVEADVGGALDAGLNGILVRTGKYRVELIDASGVSPTATVGSIADVAELLKPPS
ncbi:TIGR01458 family HAD-type hydrolase [Conexibacter sp. CPCC 206217]|uniref:TIGR01458 family HAD-type hydrolase n=1 Tax=Conexibacter sp. CPCC 206217 TaxID=3064574 RepID=UPI0027251345|nr:TIGR01458 family HAD-type hydrolase [Conexibacter sp. CPCC 206217]MDO8212434.1 TIGR01458 family HAD-type hydrolase [Conexibacter sp. CPCC 206217]